MVRKAALLLSLLLAYPAVAHYVSPNGSDTTCDGSTPDAAGVDGTCAFQTVKKCVLTAAATKCLIAPGTYREVGLNTPKSGGPKVTVPSRTCSCERGSTSIVCDGSMSASVAAGDFVQCQGSNSTAPGENQYGFFWTEVASTPTSTITLVEGYRGPSASGSVNGILEQAKFIQFIGTGATREEVVITGYVPQPTSGGGAVSWALEPGGPCAYSYEFAGKTAPWDNPQGFRELTCPSPPCTLDEAMSVWDLHDINKNRMDPYDTWDPNETGRAPCGYVGNTINNVRAVPGFWYKDATKVYLSTRSCQNPNSIQMEAGLSASTFDISDNFIIFRNMLVETGMTDKMDENQTGKYGVFISGSGASRNNVLVRNVRCHGACGIASLNGLTDILWEDIKALYPFRYGATNVSLNNSGMKFLNLEVRGGYENMQSMDGFSGVSAADPVVIDRLYVHRGWTYLGSRFIGGDDLWKCDSGCTANVCGATTPNTPVYPGYYCTGTDATTNCDQGNQVNRGAHGFYIGSATASTARTLDNILVQNCIIERTYDGLGFFGQTGQNNLTFRNCTFADSEYIGFGNKHHPGAATKIYNTLFHCPSGTCARELMYYGGPWPTPGHTTDYNAFLYDNNGTVNVVKDKIHWTNNTVSSPSTVTPECPTDGGVDDAFCPDWDLDQVRANRGQESHSIVVCSGNCSSSQGITVFNDGTNNTKLTDTTINAGPNPTTNYTPLVGSRVINAALDSQCPPHDYYGNPRVGRCDIGAIEYQGAVAAQCNDGLDNDGDLKTDYNATPGVGDSGCDLADGGPADDEERECGDDHLDDGEDCDTTKYRVATCDDLPGFDPEGVLACNANCTYNTNGCIPTVIAACGDGDDNDLDGKTDYNATPGVGDSGCKLADGGLNDTDERECPDNFTDVGEACDGTDLGPGPDQTCESLGFAPGGSLACESDCSQFDTSNCIPFDTTDPAPITTLAVGTPTATTCPVTWTNTEGGGSTVLKYAKTPASGGVGIDNVAEFDDASFYKTATPAPAGADSATITGLESGMQYAIRIVLRDAAGNPEPETIGTEDLSNLVTCTTTGIQPPTNLKTVEGAAMGGGKIE